MTPWRLSKHGRVQSFKMLSKIHPSYYERTVCDIGQLVITNDLSRYCNESELP